LGNLGETAFLVLQEEGEFSLSGELLLRNLKEGSGIGQFSRLGNLEGVHLPGILSIR
jgi:hypothetical protein